MTLSRLSCLITVNKHLIFNQIVDICFANIVNQFYGEVGYFERLDALRLTDLIKIPAVFVPLQARGDIQPKIPEISVGNQMERTISVRSYGNIWGHRWRWSTLSGLIGRDPFNQNFRPVGPRKEVHLERWTSFFRNFSGWTEPIHWV